MYNKNKRPTCIERLKTCAKKERKKKERELKWNEQIFVTQIVSPGAKDVKEKIKNLTIQFLNIRVTGILSRDITIISFVFYESEFELT